jgi:4a-hydroxytetrahydrobiopterin dehydratase
VPCEGGTPKLGAEAIASYLAALPEWRVDGDRLLKSFVFRDFVGTMAFVDRVAQTAEEEGHHPDFCVHYSRVDFTIWTHAVGGLSENDFILAAKIDALA